MYYDALYFTASTFCCVPNSILYILPLNNKEKATIQRQDQSLFDNMFSINDLTQSLTAKKKVLENQGLIPMDQAGIEPASESLFIQASPITVIVFLFPQPTAQ